MKRFLSALLMLPVISLAATTVPPQLINPSGSTVGQAIVSNGPSSAPTWQAVPLTGVTGVLPIANGGTNASTAATALSNLGGFPSAGGTITGTVIMSATSPTLFMDAATSNQANIQLRTAGSVRWRLSKDSTAESGSDAGSNFLITRFSDSGANLGSPISINRANGVTTFGARPVFGSATPWDSANLANPASTTGNLGQFASTTSAQLATVISNETGSGALVFGTSPSLTTPTIAGATLSGTFAGGHTYSGAVAFTSTITPSSTAGIVGTTTNDNANAGSVGEFVSSTVLQGAAVTLTSGTPANVTSVSVTAGDWDCRGNVLLSPSATTVLNSGGGWISTTSATLPTAPNNGAQWFTTSQIQPTQGAFGSPVGTLRVSVAATTTVYLSAYAGFTNPPMTAFGFIGCRRVR